MNSEEEQALLWKLGVSQSLKEIKAEHKLHLNHQKALAEKRLRLKIYEKEQLAARDKLLSRIRDHFNRNGEVGANFENYSFRFLLGEHLNSGLEVYHESRSRLHPSKNIVSLWQNKAHLEEFETKKAANDLYFKDQRGKGVPDLRIAQNVPYPDIQHTSSYCVEIDPDRITNLIEALEERLRKSFGQLPKTPQYQIYDSIGSRGLACILEVTFRG